MVYCHNLNIKEDYLNINDLIMFINWPNLKEFIINNYNMPIISNDLFKIKKYENENNNFKYIYLRYNINNELIYYRKGANKIKSKDILDLFNIFNNNIFKFNLKYETIDILHDKNQNKLEIKNLSKNMANYYYNYTLKELSDFLINNKTNLYELIIDGFSFKFDYIKNNTIKYLSINYCQKKENNKLLFEYLLDFEESDEKRKILLKEDLNISSKFPNLETLNIGKIKNEKTFYNKLFRASKFSNKLKEINIISFSNISLHMKSKKIQINNISILNNDSINNDKNDEDKQNIDNEYDEENKKKKKSMKKKMKISLMINMKIS